LSQIDGEEMAAIRDKNGRFKKGSVANPNGRPKKEREIRFYEITLTACTYADWREIVKKAVAQAKRGDASARKWLADYLIGPPVQRTELTGAEGAPLVVQIVQRQDD